MKYSMFTKTAAVILAVICVVGLAIGVLGIVVNLDNGYYTQTPTDREASILDDHSRDFAEQIVEEYAFSRSGMPKDIWERRFGNGYLSVHVWPEVDYRLTVEHDGNVEVVDTTVDEPYYRSATVWIERRTGFVELSTVYQPEGSPTNPTVAPGETVPEDTASTEPTIHPGGVWPEDKYDNASWLSSFWDEDTGDAYDLYIYKAPAAYTVELFYTEQEYQTILAYGGVGSSAFEQLLYSHRLTTIGLACVSLLGLLLAMTYLAAAAGQNPRNEEIRPAGLNRLPLDLYTVLDLFVGFWLCWLLFEGVLDELFYLESMSNGVIFLIAGVGLTALIGLVCVLYWCALCAQIKADGFWLRNSILGRFGHTMWSLVKRIWRRLWTWVMGLTGRVGEQVPSFKSFLRDLNNKLPLVWQWLGISVVMMVILAIFGVNSSNPGMMLLYWIMVCFCLGCIAYGARSFGELRQAAKRMSQGELDVKINADLFEGGFRDFALDLNALSDACIHAAREQLKSERMKTELITNVSHDIKTPLTSIINYVDLLKKAQTEEERQSYLEVLERQSASLKKLIEDLMEMSKASTGNLAVELAPTDVAESVHQALGEFSDRLAGRNLTVVLRKPEEGVMALCDGKLLWRVLSNLLTNVVKYTLPGTRVYVDLTRDEHRVTLSLKNISAEELNVTAEELMERFVRGDESRNTEGNGLGLNIAKSLMESQNGSLTLTVDGDLFKVILTLPASGECTRLSAE